MKHIRENDFYSICLLWQMKWILLKDLVLDEWSTSYLVIFKTIFSLCLFILWAYNQCFGLFQRQEEIKLYHLAEVL